MTAPELLDYLTKFIIASSLGFIFWLLKINTSRLGALIIDVAVIKSTIEKVKIDHDRLIILDTHVKKLSEDLNEAHKKLRRMATNDNRN